MSNESIYLPGKIRDRITCQTLLSKIVCQQGASRPYSRG